MGKNLKRSSTEKNLIELLFTSKFVANFLLQLRKKLLQSKIAYTVKVIISCKTNESDARDDNEVIGFGCAFS